MERRIGRCLASPPCPRSYSQKGQAVPGAVRCPEGSDSAVLSSCTLRPRVSPLQGGSCSLGNQGLCSGNKGTVGRSGDRPALSLGTCQVGLWTLAPGLQQTHCIRVGGGLCCEVWRSGGMPARAGRALGVCPAASLGVDQARVGHGPDTWRTGAWEQGLGEHFTAVLLEASWTLLKAYVRPCHSLAQTPPRTPHCLHTKS